MTRAERAALQVQKLKAKREADEKKFREKREADARALAHAQVAQRAADRAAAAKRRQRIGCYAEEAGLLVWEDAIIAGVFQILAQLTDAPDPVKLLDSLLGLPVPSTTPEQIESQSADRDIAARCPTPEAQQGT